ncbi:MAG: cupin domain-containing protein [Flavisolibacter sp.]|jgi:mannose-6-phosphate isomerase-like protein (cupin superfamily)|nr:cupin domain-containing protein [Flavisolibacter sp.]
MQKVNIKEKFSLFADHWHPRIAGELNGQHVKLVKLKGPFIWHQHENEDELFLVISGILKMELEEQTIEILPGEFIIIPKGTLHRPVADDEVEVLLFEPASTINTGDQNSGLRQDQLQKI